jgi:hypothetical protein
MYLKCSNLNEVCRDILSISLLRNSKIYFCVIKLCPLVQSYGTLLVTQHASKPAEYKDVD